jgi:sugar/nucleoside kinase (ribokinase family)
MTKLNKGIGVVGSTTIDTIVSQHQSVTKIGGVTAYAGITYSRHGLDTFVVSNIANNDRTIIDRLKQENIIVLNGKTNRTTHFVNDIKKDSRRQELFNRARSIQLRQLSAVIKRVGGLHLGPLHPDDIESEALTALHNTDLKIFLDVQGYTRKVVTKRVSAAVSRHLPAALSAAHIIKANGTELKYILEHYQKGLTELMKTFEIEESVITLGQEGGWVETLSGDKFHYKADKIESVTDPTGAGDVFFAAYIISRFANNRDIPDACRYAASTAARQVEGTHISIDRLGLP